MAFSIRITGIPSYSDAPIWQIDNFHYPPYKLMKDPMFRKSVDSTLYVDYVAVLNTEDALELHTKYRLEPWGDDHKIKEELLLTRLRKGAPETIWVLYEVYEWESGLSD